MLAPGPPRARSSERVVVEAVDHRRCNGGSEVEAPATDTRVGAGKAISVSFSSLALRVWRIIGAISIRQSHLQRR